MKKTVGVVAAGVLSLLLLVIGCTDEITNGTGPGEPGLSGLVTGHTDCKEFVGDAAYVDISEDKSCIDYVYDGQGTLTLKHVNAGFNCCPDILDADISLVGDTLVIEEHESLMHGGCDCLCLFDLDMEVKNLDPGRYYIKVIELYVHRLRKRLVQAEVGIRTVRGLGYIIE